jgi:hypothetical protein
LGNIVQVRKYGFDLDTPLGRFKSPIGFEQFLRAEILAGGVYQTEGLYILAKTLAQTWRFHVRYVGETCDTPGRLTEHLADDDWDCAFIEDGLAWPCRRFWEAAVITGLLPPRNTQVVRYLGEEGETPQSAALTILKAEGVAKLRAMGIMDANWQLIHPSDWTPVLRVKYGDLVLEAPEPN